MSGGLQIAFWKMVEGLKGPPLYVPHDEAVRVVAARLSDLQWAKFAESHPRNGVPR